MSVNRTTRWYVALLAAAAAAALFLITGVAGKPASGQVRQDSPPPTFAPTEQIDVEQAVSFPYDI